MSNLEIKEYCGKKLSCFRTFNRAKFYADIRSENDAIDAFELAKKKDCRLSFSGRAPMFFLKIQT